MNDPTRTALSPLSLTDKELKRHAVQLMVWLWPGAERELWHMKLCCGKTLADLSMRLVPSDGARVHIVDDWAMTVAMMLNGTQRIAGDPDPFTIEAGKPPQLQAWRLLVIHSLALLPAEGYLLRGVARLALNTVETSRLSKAERDERIGSIGADIVHYLNGQGRGNSIAWLRSLDLTRHEKALLACIRSALQAWRQALDYFAAQLPETSVLAACMTRQKYGVHNLNDAAASMVPLALKDLARLLGPLQTSIPKEADRQLGGQASLPYQFKTMIPNQFYIERIDVHVIAELFANHASAGTTEEGRTV